MKRKKKLFSGPSSGTTQEVCEFTRSKPHLPISFLILSCHVGTGSIVDGSSISLRHFLSLQHKEKQVKNNQAVYQKPSSNLPRLQIPSSSSSTNQNAPQNSIPFGQIPLLNPFIVQPGMFKSPEQYERNMFYLEL